MAKYVLEGEKTEREVEVRLVRNGDTISLMVGEWYVFDLRSNGTGRLQSAIRKDNEEGLQVDEDGRIKLI